MFNPENWRPHLQPGATVIGTRRVAQLPTARRQDKLLDDALKETFPASDPISVVRIT